MHSYSILSFCDWLISLSTRSWWVLPAGRCVRITSFFKSWIRSHGMNTTVCSSTDEHELFDLVTTVNNSIMHRGSLWDADFSSLGYVSRSGITGSYNNFFFLFSFFFFFEGQPYCWYSHQQCAGISISPRLCQRLFSVCLCFCFIMAILMSIKGCLTMVLICIFQS